MYCVCLLRIVQKHYGLLTAIVDNQRNQEKQPEKWMDKTDNVSDDIEAKKL